MRPNNISVKNRLLFGAVLVPFGLIAAGSGVSAVDTQIGAVVCGSGAPGAFIQITQPLNDSVLEQPVVSFRGNVNNTAQIEVFIDGTQDRTVAIGANQTTFLTDLSLSEGTHTVTMKANDICGGQDDEDSVAITYTPAVSQPSTGGMTPTTLEGAVTLDGEPVNAEAVDDSEFMQQIEQLPIIGAAVSVVTDFATAIGLESTIASGNAPAATGVARVGITVAALTSVVMASTLAPMAAQAIPGVSEVFNVSSHRSMMYLGWVIRGAGLLALAFAYFL